MDRELSSEFGKIKVHKRALIQIIENITLSIKGVKGVGADCLPQIIREIFKVFNITTTKIKLGKDLKISIPISVSLEENLQDVACEVQKKVIDYLFRNLNVDSITVDVKIKKIEGGKK